MVTGGASGIGRRIADRFTSEGALVEVIDKAQGHWFVGDIANPETLEEFARMVKEKYGRVDVLINNALPIMKGLDECTWEEFMYAQKVGVAAPFYLSKLFKDYFAESSSIVNISSTRAFMSQPQTESYSAAKGGITALTHAMAMSLAPKVRVNSVSPGWIDTMNYDSSIEDRIQHPAGRIGTPDDIASIVLFLCSQEAGFMTGENVVVDGGMTRQMIYHGDNGWKLGENYG